VSVEPQATQRIPPWLATVLLVVVVLLPNANSLGAFFVGDDFDFLARVQRMERAADTLRMSYWGEWEPLWYVTFYRDWTLWGLAPAGYHAVNLLWLALGVTALYRLVAELWPGVRLAPWAAALLFAAHPLHDEAVTYLAARGHPMSAALGLWSLFAYARARRAGHSRLCRLAWWGTALGTALLAALAKETALLLPLWIVVLEWCVFGGLRPKFAALWRAVSSGLIYAIPVSAYLALRYAAVGLGSHKLRGPDDGLLDLLESFVSYLPEYALVGGVPLPFAFVDRDVVGLLRPAGWLVVAAVLLPAGVAVVRALRRKGEVSRPRRRYFYTSSAGAALAASVALQWLAARRSRAAWALTVVLALAGAAGLVYRNELYRSAGRITLNLLETVRGAPLGTPSMNAPRGKRRVALVTLPRYLAGDGLSGAYVLHETDTRSVFRLAGVEPEGFSTGLKCYHAEDYAAEVAFVGEDVLDLTVTFRSRRAYEAALRRSPAEDREGRFVQAVLDSSDDGARVLTYKVILAEGFLRRDAGTELYLYSDGAFRRLTGPG
jgi:hypothetical protein